MYKLLEVLTSEWNSYNEEKHHTVTFLNADNNIHIYKEDDILLGVVIFLDRRVVIDLEKCEDEQFRKIVSYFLTKVISSCLIGTPILVANTCNFY